MDNARYERWVKASHGLGRIETFMMPILQGLGRLDCQLIPQDMRFGQLSQEAQSTIEESILLTDRFTSSYLWVLGAYELIRTIDQRCRDDASLLSAEIAAHVRELKHAVNRLRIPLAKMEAAKKSPTDSPIAYPAINPNLGIAWQVAEETFISRREISDALLQLAEAIRAYEPMSAR